MKSFYVLVEIKIFMTKILQMTVLMTALMVSTVWGQLAVTEIMTSESSTSNSVPGAPSHPDWWELSNYGTNDIDLTGYSWNDNSHNGLYSADTTPFTGVIIHAGEAIIFTEVNTVITDGDSFRAWWGISPSVQVIACPSGDPGLGATGDSVRLWLTNNANLNFDITYDEAPQFLVDHEDAGVAIAGRTLLYNTNSGMFDLSSTNGIAGAFRAVTADDEGSPGVMPAAVPVFISQQPTNFTTTVGQAAVFTIAGRGLPKPTFQWRFKGVPVDSTAAGVTIINTNGVSVLSLSNVQTNQAGAYSVLISNGLTNVASSNATLTVNPAPTKPAIVQAPFSMNAYPGQTVTFTVQASGNPAPSYQWQFSGGTVIGAANGLTSNQLILSISDTNQTGTYTVAVTNAGGSTNVSVTLTVTPKPNLLITEVMSSEASPSTGHADWWELSNFGSFPVDLHGFRMNDSHALSSAFTITNNAVIQPGESVVFCEGITAAAFRTWWGSNLPPNLQIITYDGTGRGLSATADEVRVWNQAAMVDADRVTSVSFSTAAAGASFGFNPEATDQFGFVGNSSQWVSTNGYNGAFTAAVSGDIGSPGRVVNWPGVAVIKPGGGLFNVTWTSQPNRIYNVQYTTEILPANWLPLTNVTAVSNVCTVADSANNPHRFYRVSLTHIP